MSIKDIIWAYLGIKTGGCRFNGPPFLGWFAKSRARTSAFVRVCGISDQVRRFDLLVSYLLQVSVSICNPTVYHTVVTGDQHGSAWCLRKKSKSILHTIGPRKYTSIDPVIPRICKQRLILHEALQATCNTEGTEWIADDGRITHVITVHITCSQSLL